MLAAGCAGADIEVSEPGGSSTSAAPTAPAPSAAPSSPTPPASTAPGGPAPTTAARRAGGNRPASPPAGADSFAAARTSPGTFATVLLRPQPAARLVLEVLQQPGAEPNPPTVAHLARVLQDSSAKPVSVTTVSLPAGGGAVSADSVRGLADRYGRTEHGGGQAVVRMLFLGGRLQGDDSALGAAVRGDTAAVFVEQVRSASSPLVGASALEQAVATHELGHLLGLVDLVLSTGRADPEHPGHSPSRGSVMYWAIESGLVSSVLSGPPPRDFDAADRADVAAIRSGPG